MLQGNSKNQKQHNYGKYWRTHTVPVEPSDEKQNFNLNLDKHSVSEEDQNDRQNQKGIAS